ncbi:LptF/LptG family permease [Alphaproteobacteria bacterium LSUCC0684]
MSIVALIDTAELFRRVSNKSQVENSAILLMEAMKIPSTLPDLIPFGVLIGSIFSFHKLRSTNEVVIARTSGLSLLKFMVAPITFVFLFSIFALVVIDPIASATKKRYLALEDELFGSKGRNLSVSTEGIWFRDQQTDFPVIIHGEAIDSATMEIIAPVVYTFGQDDKLITRYYPDHLFLKDGFWLLEGGKKMGADGVINSSDITQLETSLRERDLNHSNKRPETIPFFELWSYISVLEKAGLSSLGHSSYLYYLMFMPFVLVGMIMIAGRFALAYSNRQGWIHLVVFTLGLGLTFYFVKDFLYVLGSSGRLPPVLAGSAPGVIMISLGTGLLFRADE